eukprot:TRINITY_DN6315_c0_g1_i1.p1 TRINITY_DN6315_c0_g1~~TRINITY_DN6315_c0_g1_i1.p1  ORF type:complete len:134 (-),score=4.08 TRINITY_DN6315_c0_g1_i1:35-436(-)
MSLSMIYLQKIQKTNSASHLWIQTDGIAMGNCASPDIADITLAGCEYMMHYDTEYSLKNYMCYNIRYIDDFCTIVPPLNLQLHHVMSMDPLHYHKINNAFDYPHFKSYQPGSIHIENMKKRFINRGYPSTMSE